MTDRERQHLEDAIETLRQRFEEQLQTARDRDERTNDPRWSTAQRTAIVELLELDALERATRDLGEDVQRKLRARLALARTSAGIPMVAIAAMLGRSRALLDGWLKKPNT